MRTTLVIDDDLLAAAKHLSEQQHKSLGEVISALARQARRPGPADAVTRGAGALWFCTRLSRSPSKRPITG